MFQQDGRPKTGADAKFKEHLHQKSAQELRAELDMIFEEEARTGVNADPALVAEYFTAIETMEPDDNVQIPGDFETSWAIFQKNHPELFPKKETKTRKRTLQPFRLVEAAVLVGVLLVFSASAFRWPDYLVRWGQGKLHLIPTSGVMELTEPNEEGFTSMEDALAAIGADDLSIPTWIPEEFEIQMISVQVTPAFSQAVALYASEDFNVVLRISRYYNKVDMPDTSFEVNENKESTVYTRNDIEHVLTYNLDRLQAVWVNGNCLCNISGNISIDEMEKMIDSIYGG